MKKSIKDMIEDLGNEDILYYYEQGFLNGKEEATFSIITNMTLSNIPPETISKMTNTPLEIIDQLTE